MRLYLHQWHCSKTFCNSFQCLPSSIRAKFSNSFKSTNKKRYLHYCDARSTQQGCIIRSILPSGMGARGGKWRIYHSGQTRFYQTDDSKVTRRLLKEKSKLTFADVLIKIFIACLLKEVKNSLFPFRHSYLQHLSRRFKKL